MGFWELDSIKSVVGGTWLARPESVAGVRLDGCTTDTRTLRPGQVYVAIRGERFDGNAFVPQAALAGAPLAIIDTPSALPMPLPVGIAILHVPDAGLALLRLAGAYRRTLDGTRVIAVTGSNGKTTTTRLIQAVLSTTLRGTASIKSYNNRVGVPVTILGAKRGDQYLICEVGTNALGEIAELAGVVEPDIAVVTSIGREHLEGLGSIKGAVSEAVALVNAVRPGGLVVMNADVPLLEEAVTALAQGGATPRFNIVRFGFSAQADLRITTVEQSAEKVRFCVNDRAWHEAPLLGRHNALNAAAALAVGRRLGVDTASADRGLAQAKGAEMRLERTNIHGIDIINDAYNANPESMLAALDTAAQLGKGEGRRVVILGDMLELGEAGPDAHREIGDRVVELGCFDLVVLVGPLSMFAAERISRALAGDRIAVFNSMNAEVAGAVASMLQTGDHVLLKGSRGMGLERVVKALAHSESVGVAEVQVKSPTPPVGAS